jgi:hypothetical protein
MDDLHLAIDDLPASIHSYNNCSRIILRASLRVTLIHRISSVDNIVNATVCFQALTVFS